MAKCKYPNEVCANMTVLHGETYCDSVPCSLKDEVQKQTNADRIRNMTDEELAEFLANVQESAVENGADTKESIMRVLQAEAKEGADDE